MISTILIGALLAAAPPPEPLPITGPAVREMPPAPPRYMLKEPTAELEFELESKFTKVVEDLFQPESQECLAKASGAKILEWKLKSVDLVPDESGNIKGGRIFGESVQEIRGQKITCKETIILKPGLLSFVTESELSEEKIKYFATTLTIHPAEEKTKVVIKTWVEHATIKELWVRIGARSSMLRTQRCLEQITKPPVLPPNLPQPKEDETSTRKGVAHTILS